MQDYFNASKGRSVPPASFASVYHDDIQPEDLETVTCSDEILTVSV
jgi:hypothetical protein